uniref:peptidylamidoglycolate lyase n=1 Tax=Meloidogyne hapla TaxID=6305 RepID=A0A1I8BXI8_MELHA
MPSTAFGNVLFSPSLFSKPSLVFQWHERNFAARVGSALAQLQNNQHKEIPYEEKAENEQEIEGIDELKDEESYVLQLPPNIGQAPGIALDPLNRLVLFHRSGRVWDELSLGIIPNTTIAVIDTESGAVLEEHGKNMFYMPHGLTIDAHGNSWLTDVGSHQIHKLDKDFKVIMSLGEKLVPGSDDKHFCKPTDVAIASTGEFFVADGYCNSRIMKFDREGKLLSQFGQPDSSESPRNGEFLVPHSLTLIEDLNLLCVADRENERIQCFSAGLEGAQHQHRRAYVPTGTFFTKAENIGRVFAIREKEHFLVGVTNQDQGGQLESQVFVMDMNTGRANSFAKGLENAHALAISENGDIYVSQIEPNQIVKFSIATNEN